MDLVAPELERSNKFSKSTLSTFDDIWRVWVVEKRRPFDREQCIETAVRARHYSWDNTPCTWADRSVMSGDWAEKDGLLSPEEAAFWFSLVVVPGYLSGGYDDPEVDKAWIEARCDLISGDAKPDDFFDLLDTHVFGQSRYDTPAFAVRLLRDLVPYDQLIRQVAEKVEFSELGSWLQTIGPPPAAHRAATVEVIEELIKDMDGAQLASSWNMTTLLQIIPCQAAIDSMLTHTISSKGKASLESYRLIFALDDKERAKELLKGIKISSYYTPSSDDVVRFFNYFGYENLDLLVKNFLKPFRKKGIGAAMDELFKIKAPEVVEPLAYFHEVKELESKVEDYVVTSETWALDGLLRSCGARNKGKTFGLGMLRKILTEDEELAYTVRAIAKARHKKSVQQLIDAEFFDAAGVVKLDAKLEFLDPAEYNETLAEIASVTWPKKTKRPAWLDEDKIPTMFFEGSELAVGADLIAGLLALMRTAKKDTEQKEAIEKAKAFFAEIKGHSVEALLDAIAQQWSDAEDKKPKFDDAFWVFNLLSAYPCDSVVDILDHYIRRGRDRWQIRSIRPTLKKACTTLYEMNIPEAFYVLKYQSEHLTDDDMRGYVRNKLNGYKTKKKLSDEEFEDFAVPTFGFDKTGTRVFDFGARQIKLVVRGRDDISFLDETNPKKPKVYQKFPPSRKTDDPDKYAVAREQYKHISETFRAVLKEQNMRMERAMLTGRTWSAESWLEFVARHPLLAHLARRIVWRVGDKQDNFIAAVLPDQEGNFIDLDFEEFDIDPDKHLLSVLHPIELDDDDRQGWIDQLVDYEVIQPFEQLDRDVHTREEATAYMADFHGRLDVKKLWTLPEHGWDKGYYATSFRRLHLPLRRPEGKFEVEFDYWIENNSYSWNYHKDVGVQSISWKDKSIYSADGKFDAKKLDKVPDLALSELINMLDHMAAVDTGS